MLRETAIFEGASEDATGARPEGIFQRRASQGIVLLVGQVLSVRAIGFVSNVLLARWLTPEIFGVFAIVNFVVVFCRFFSDFGLAGAMVQKPKELTDDDLITSFTIQQGIVALLVLIVFFSAPFIATTYGLNPSTMWVIRALSLNLLLGSFRTMSAVQLERHLLYRRLVPAEVAETLTYQGIALFLAYSGYEVWSFVWASLVSTLIGIGILYAFAPWPLRLGIKRETTKELFKFSLPYQLVRTMNLINDSLTPIVVGMLAGPAAMGYLGWAGTLLQIPTFFMQSIVARMTFPTFSRLQSDDRALGRVVEAFIFLSSLTFYPLAFTLLGIGSQLVHFVYTDKWQPGLPALYLMVIGNFSQPFGGVVINQLLFGTGKLSVMTKLTVFWAVITWLLGVPLVLKYGYLGVPLMQLVGSVTVVWPIWEARKVCRFHPLRTALPPFLAGLVAFFFLRAVASRFVQDIPTLMGAVTLAVLVYTGVLVMGWRRSLMASLKVMGLVRRVHTQKERLG